MVGLQKIANHVEFLKQVSRPRKLLNLLIKEVQFRLGSTRLLYFPNKITIDIGNVCNLKCPLCPTGRGDPGVKRGFMKLEDYKRIIDEVGPYLTKLELHNWGEPLLNKDLIPMIQYAKTRNIPVQISTNLTVLTKETADALMATRLEKIFISCDAASADTYSIYRVGGDFGRLIANIRLLTKARERQKNNYTRVKLLFHVFRHNQHEVEKVKELARDLGVELVIGAMRTDMGKEVFEPVREAIERDGDWIPTNPTYSAYDLKTKDKKRQTTCHELWKTAVINWDGGVFPCCAVFGDKYRFGNVYERSFRSVWNNDSYRLARMELSDRIEESHTVCHLCKETGFLHF